MRNVVVKVNDPLLRESILEFLIDFTHDLSNDGMRFPSEPMLNRYRKKVISDNSWCYVGIRNNMVCLLPEECIYFHYTQVTDNVEHFIQIIMAQHLGMESVTSSIHLN